MHRLLKRISCGLFAGSAVFAFTAALAQPYPSKPVRFVVSFVPGGGLDTLARAISPRLSSGLGQPVIVENRPASGGVVAAEFVAKSAPDGYTVLMSGSWMVVGSLLYRNLNYHADRDFTPVILIAEALVQLFVHESVPSKTLREFVEHVKANPGKLNYGSAGIGHPFHLAMEMFKQRTGVNLVHVPYKGMGPAVQDFMAGRTQALFYSANSQFLEMIRTGRVRALATATDQRLSSLPDVPTMAELGIADFKPAANVAVVGPAGLPRPVVDRLHGEFGRATAAPEVLGVYDKLLFAKLHSTPEEYGQIVKKELAVWGPLIKSLNIALD